MSNFYMGLSTTASSPSPATSPSTKSHHAAAPLSNGGHGGKAWPKPPVNSDDLRMGDHIRVRSVEEITAYAIAGGSSVSTTALSSSDSKAPAAAATPAVAPHVAFLGFPYDEGCGRNGGRIGAADAPANVRKLMQRMGTLVNPEHHVDLRTIQMSDVGDIKAGLSLEDAHIKLEETVHQLLTAGCIPFVVGGSNDQSYPNVAALLHAKGAGNVGTINIDAHLDVRPLKEGKAHSGSPFRQMLEDSRFKGGHFIEFAAQGNQCSQVHADYALSKGATIYWLRDIRDAKRNTGSSDVSPVHMDELFWGVLEQLGTNVFVSFDIDSITGADCPGVSAPGTIGLTADEALTIAFVAGLHPRVMLFDVSEHNPRVEDYRTGRLVANLFLFFSYGLARRYAYAQRGTAVGPLPFTRRDQPASSNVHVTPTRAITTATPSTVH